MFTLSACIIPDWWLVNTRQECIAFYWTYNYIEVKIWNVDAFYSVSVQSYAYSAKSKPSYNQLFWTASSSKNDSSPLDQYSLYIEGYLRISAHIYMFVNIFWKKKNSIIWSTIFASKSWVQSWTYGIVVDRDEMLAESDQRNADSAYDNWSERSACAAQ